MRNKFIWSIVLVLGVFRTYGQVADPAIYLQTVREEMQKTWPHNRCINLVFHGHSVPAGYARTPNVATLQAYPQQVLRAVKEFYPYAVVNCITTGIGGENSEQGVKRFQKEVLSHRPDVLFMDYALNDRAIGLARARKAWESMIQMALKQEVKVILCTPTPDLTEDISDEQAPLAHHAAQIRQLARQYEVGLVDNYAFFRQLWQEGRDLRLYMSQSNHPNEAGHQIAAYNMMMWLVNPAQRRQWQTSEVKALLRKVADWQREHFEQQVVKGSAWKDSHAYWAWTNATMYVGMARWAQLCGEQKYWDFLYVIGEKNRWRVGPRIFFADDLCVAQLYQMMYEKYEESKMVEAIEPVLDSIIAADSRAVLDYDAPGSHSRWCWCDALFMGPTVFARYGKLLGKEAYFDYLHREFRATTETLYDPEERLFLRDTRYRTMREKNGEKVFWGRGNGWVMGALTILLEYLPADDSLRDYYLTLYREMTERIAGLQDARGFWHASLLDPEAYPMPETSSSGFFTYALLWGVRHGYLSSEKYYPIALKGWKALCSAVLPDGKLGYVQAIGADPKTTGPHDTEVYGVGAFLLAGCELVEYLNEKKQ